MNPLTRHFQVDLGSSRPPTPVQNMQDVVGNQVLIKDTGFERFKVEANKTYNDEDINATGFSLRSIYNDANKKYAKGSGGFLYSILYQRFFRDLNDAEKNC